ncbi:MAG TPA: transketolase [Actinobacteria bacterium]|nr:putative 33.6 kDa protein in fasciation locus precursor [bacterium BMS3Bbin02]HDL42296.1 transketolase [Actinomycetota bacterium]
MRAAFVETATALLAERDDIAVVLADISVGPFERSGAIAAFPHRVFNVGIREQLMLSVTGGMALEGMRPIAHSYTPFLIERAYEQIKLDLGHQGVGAILVSIGASYDDPGSGRTHAAPEDVSLINALPAWTVYIPGHADEARLLLRDAAERTDKVYIRLDATQNSSAVEHPSRLTTIRSGLSGSPLVIAVGPMLDRVLAAAGDMDVAVAYTAAPLAQSPADLAATMKGDDLIIVEPTTAGTSLGRIAGQLSDRPRRFLGIGVPLGEHRLYGTVADHEAHHGLNATGIRHQITEWLS